LTIESSLNSLNQELRNLGKNGKAELLHKASRDGNRPETFWDKCKNHKETITLVQTDLNSVIEFYCPDKWEDTTKKYDLKRDKGWKNIKSGKPFIFYFLNNEIEIIKYKVN
jgi:hypothetical protein